MKILTINCSPRKKQSNSYHYINILNKFLKFDYYQINNKNYSCEQIINYDHIIFVFPLYADSLPAQLLTFLEINKSFLKNKKVSILVNCGFYEYKHNDVAFLIFKKIAKTFDFNIINTFQIATGEAILTTIYKYFIYLKCFFFANAIKKDKYKNYKTRMLLTKKLFILGSNNYWNKLAKKFNCPQKTLSKMDFN